MGLSIYNEFFTEELYDELIHTSRSLLKEGANNFCTNNWWDPKLIKDSFPVLIHGIYKDSKLFNKTRKQIENKVNLDVNDSDILIYYWTRFSYIPWHRDQSYDGALTVYLNEEWHEDWGGYFLYEEKENDIRAVLPKRNLGLLQKGGIRHSTTPVSYDGGVRISIQVFFNK